MILSLPPHPARSSILQDTIKRVADRLHIPAGTVLYSVPYTEERKRRWDVDVLSLYNLKAAVHAAKQFVAFGARQIYTMLGEQSGAVAAAARAQRGLGASGGAIGEKERQGEVGWKALMGGDKGLLVKRADRWEF